MNVTFNRLGVIYVSFVMSPVFYKKTTQRYTYITV